MSRDPAGSRVRALTRSGRTDGRRVASRSVVARAMLLLLVAAGCREAANVGPEAPSLRASHTAAPASVTVAGSLESEIGCSGDWDPGCAAAHLTFDAGDDVWQGTWTLPAGAYEYKAALNDSWDENYGLHAVPNGANAPLSLAASGPVKFYYDHETHWITDDHSSVIATAPGSFQSELGCPADWDPGCLRSWLEDPDGDGVYTFSTSAIPVGSYETKVAIREAWDENYGQGGAPNGANIPFSVATSGSTVAFSYDGSTHVLTVTVTPPLLAWAFTGFLSPVANPPTLNDVTAGSTIPVKFSLGGNRGLDIFAAGSPSSSAITCPSAMALRAVVTVASPTRKNPLTYDASTGVYTYSWVTNKSWKGGCRTLTLALSDGTSHEANFRFR